MVATAIAPLGRRSKERGAKLNVKLVVYLSVSVCVFFTNTVLARRVGAAVVVRQCTPALEKLWTAGSTSLVLAVPILEAFEEKGALLPPQ